MKAALQLSPSDGREDGFCNVAYELFGRSFVSSSDFRQIAVPGDRGKKERLFRAAVTAFASLTRPSRKEIAQLEDLALPLYDHVSVEGRRFVAAVLSELKNPPLALVRRLAEESVDIAAPLLLRSRALSDVDLIALIGRHGLPHARVVARRQNLNPTITQLVRALTRSQTRVVATDDASQRSLPMKPALSAPFEPLAPLPRQAPEPEKTHAPGEKAEQVRDQLRAMMEPAAEVSSHMSDNLPRAPSQQRETLDATFQYGPRPGTYAKLRDTALTGVVALFHTALADALEIDMIRARAITAAVTGFADLMAALKYLELTEDQAFVVIAALHPQKFGHGEAIRLLLERYRLLHPEAAADKARGWREASFAAAIQPELRPTVLPSPANGRGRPVAFGKALKAS